MKWASKAPGKASSASNILKIFDKTSWFLTLISMVFVSCVLIAAYALEYHFGSTKPDILLLILLPLAMLNAEALPVEDVTKKSSWKGFTRNFILLLWSVMGMVLVFCFLCNLRAMILKPVREKPIDTARDLVLGGKTPILVGPWKDHLAAAVNPWQRKTAKLAMLIPGPTRIKDNLETLVQKEGTHSVLASPNDIAFALKGQENSAAIHFSKETILPYYSGWVITKLSPWKKILDDLILLIQQVTANNFLHD